MSTTRTSPADVPELRRLQVGATRRLLGETVRLSEEEWRTPTALPGWTRAHLASHLARHAEALAAFVRGHLAGRPAPLYPSREARDGDIERGAARSGPELQNDLDASAGALEEAFDEVPGPVWRARGEPRPGFAVELGLLPVMRLAEVELHRVDLGLGARVRDLPPEVALPLLGYLGLRQAGRTDYPGLQLVPQEAPDRALVLGAGDAAPQRVTAPAAVLVGLLTRRVPVDEVPGAAGLELPPLG
ncbi:maleylpyruvate isomerase family mycothiol-dependent enzyme [Desertihabitans brevis]|uniref:Maleylpyruvate isomerase family mycothiol-dependent enzyme n=1 Tax=Desertihabitans brevis TaxID=2268447 RepID=A0A367YZZ3_9ACTN|nr:maleylpyruvate isomerase family mycothiol-dependent enzyme [Desertihabitans brevis]RCK70582.1 maleylpyruvate isomerase family mycothiol-dependent enzyme [Desertihabitans brevis]